MAGSDAVPYRCLQFEVLGPLRVVRDGTPIGVGGAQQRAVLAFLLTEQPRAVSVGQIAEALWPARRPPAGYTATIQSYVFRLREVLEPGRAKGAHPHVLVTEPGGYRLHVDPRAVDVAEFERLLEAGETAIARGSSNEGAADLARALALWRGPVLADLAGYEFVARFARRLDELRLQAVESRIDADLALGRHAAVIAELESLAQSHALREHLQAQRILALYRAGRQADALAVFRSVRTRMLDDLGIEPGAELADLHQSILIQDAALQLERPAPAPPAFFPTPTADPLRGVRVSVRSPKPSRRLIAMSVVGAVILAAMVTYAVGSRSSGRRPLPANSLVRIAADGSFHDAVAVGVSPDGVVLANGAAWVANTGDDSVSKVDLTTHAVVQTTPVGKAPQALAVSGSDLWVVNGGSGTVSRLSLRTNRIIETVPVGNLPSAIASGVSGVWVVVTGDNTVVRINPMTGKAGKPISVGLRPSGIAIDADTAWVSNSGDATVSPIDVKTSSAGHSIAVGAGPTGIIAAPGGIWVANSLNQSVSRIDPTARQVDAVVRVGDGPNSFTAVGDRLWVSNELDGSVTIIDPPTGRVVQRIATGSAVRGLAGDGGSAYVTTRSSADDAHRGGTLRITTGLLPNVHGVDPAQADDTVTLPAFSYMYDGLVGLQRTGGAPGLTLVPDLAVDLPQPSPDGLTYTFTVRRGIRYSNGAGVRPSDIRRGVQQALTLSGSAAGQLSGIVGATACVRSPLTCDLSAGIEVDDAAFQITFYLTGPDPDFLYKLLAPVFATPEGEPGVPATTPHPATGPYMIGESSDSTFALVRNPNFRSWSFAAQPAGYPDRIEWTVDPDLDHAMHNVLAGLTDADQRFPGMVDYSTLQRTSPEYFHSEFTAWTTYMFLNTNVAPFNDPDARRAVNFAVDREKLVSRLGGTASARPTCQILPPNFPGYRRYCPYTSKVSADGRYSGPDLVRAAALITRSGTRGMSVTVNSYWDDPASRTITKYVTGVLTRLGYKARVRISPADNYFSRDNPAQIGLAMMGADYPAPSAFLGLLRCSTDLPGGYCNPAAERLFARTTAIQRTDPTRAYRDWARLDRTITDDAAWVSLYNPQFTIVLSDRVGNYLSHPRYGALYPQMWVAT